MPSPCQSPTSQLPVNTGDTGLQQAHRSPSLSRPSTMTHASPHVADYERHDPVIAMAAVWGTAI
ncbi:hypothetical protein QIS74_04567 [Colletotrichum tabaci]|uniref:Uncharacterized protein n=1 Tax=Colletotrichum tabaci TaxID=1209068 RepID=A0AAV9THQ4_9PEZI